MSTDHFEFEIDLTKKNRAYHYPLGFFVLVSGGRVDILPEGYLSSWNLKGGQKLKVRVDVR